MLTLHPTSKRTASGYVPMVCIRNERGHMIGSRTPQGDAREFRTFASAIRAEVEARYVALRTLARLQRQGHTLVRVA
jgi:hypothetical protein